MEQPAPVNAITEFVRNENVHVDETHEGWETQGGRGNCDDVLRKILNYQKVLIISEEQKINCQFLRWLTCSSLIVMGVQDE